MFKAGFSVLWHSKCLMISLMPLDFYLQKNSERKDVNSKRAVSE